MTTEEHRGERIVKTVALVTMAVTVASALERLFWAAGSSQAPMLEVVLPAVLGLMIYRFVYLGYRWPRWFLLVALVFQATGLLLEPSLVKRLGVVDVLFSLWPVVVAVLLFGPRSVRAFYRWQRETYRRPPPSISTRPGVLHGR